MTLYKFSSYFDETYGMAQQNPVKRTVYIFRIFSCKSNAHENWQKSGENESSFSLHFIPPFVRSRQNIEETDF